MLYCTFGTDIRCSAICARKLVANVSELPYLAQAIEPLRDFELKMKLRL
jgi:hypothetical protein